MTTQRLRQIEEIFSRILELPRDQRAGALRASCGSDGSLRAEVESLMGHADPPDEFLSDSALGGVALPALAEPVDDLVGEMVGPYRIVQRRASGGMGTVYIAARADGQFEQQTAIKVVKRGMDTEEILRRFTQERRMLASLRHPNIAQLLDAGAMADGRPYLVMEYVQGVAIDHYCDEHQLTITQRLRLFCVVCEAVRLAHQKLVVHRDLKPSNILVDDNGVPKLLDFGVSKVLVGTESGEATVLEERRFTPEYASPEQVTGQPLSTASDVYSLGIILYELLCGRRPYGFATRTVAEICRIVCEHEITPPSVAVQRDDERLAGRIDTAAGPLNAAYCRREASSERLRRRLNGDLDTIVLKATHKDPSRRYTSVDQFVDDIERHLAGMPVLARPDTLVYRIQKLVRRNTLAVAGGVCALMLLGIGVAATLWQARVARHERDAAYLARDQAEATADFLQKMMSAADPANEGSEATVRSVLDAAAQRVDSDLKNQPLVQAAVRSTIGRTYLGLGLLEQAERNIEAAQVTRAAHLEPGHHDLAESEFDLAQLYYAQGEYSEAEKLLNDCLATHRRLRGEENLDTARVLNDLGAVLRAGGKIVEAEATHREALKIREKLVGRESLEAAETLNNLSGVLRAKGDGKGAENLMEEALRIRRELLRDEHPLVLQSMANLAIMASSHGDVERGERLLREVVALDRKVFGAQHTALAVDLAGLGRNLMLQKRFADAEPLLRESLEIRRRRLTPNDQRLLKTQAALGECLVAQGRDAEAEPLLADALQKSAKETRAEDGFWTGIAETLDKLHERTGQAPKPPGDEKPFGRSTRGTPTLFKQNAICSARHFSGVGAS